MKKSIIKLFLPILLISLSPKLLSQKMSQERIDFLMTKIPDSSTLSIQGIASYIYANINGQKNRAYAIFSWTTEKISYDVKNMFNINFDKDKKDFISEVLSSRIGDCLHFSYLFQEVARKVGIKSYVVFGFTKQNGLMDPIPHAWCASLIDSEWYLFDPTWGSGYFENGAFIKKRNPRYFMVPPEKFIKTHMPYDPIWQFLNYPVNNYDFYYNKAKNYTEGSFFNYQDSIIKYESQPEMKRIESSILRINQNGITNVVLAREVNYLYDQILTLRYNRAVILYNEGLTQLNQSIMLWNQFNPEKDTPEISRLLDLSEQNMNICRNDLSQIKNQNGIMKTAINQLYSLIEIVENSIKNIRSSVERYNKSRSRY